MAKIDNIIKLAEKLPFFTFDDLAGIESNRTYLKILFSRYEKSGKLIRIKKGVYVTKSYLNNLKMKNRFSNYPEFIAAILYPASYLSLDYILYQHNLLTEIPSNFTLITKNKTARIKNQFGNYFFHKIRDNLFCGYKITKENDFTIYKASKAKALFDFLYLRKNDLLDERSIKELRLNLMNLNNADVKEFKKYIKIEKSKKMQHIFELIIKQDG